MMLLLTAGSLFRLPSELPEDPRQNRLPESLSCEHLAEGSAHLPGPLVQPAEMFQLGFGERGWAGY